ncbi:MAG: MFS transporter [Verrucomicrobiota bacterium]|jgi:OPA family glycerol-3-phosphate transporter-like MFS transporter/OPA family sugar phosphate sensor protein UhpC-like MFS transporter
MSLTPAAGPNPANEPAEASSLFRYWQIRTLVATMFGYAAFYFVRKNLSFAMPEMEKDLLLSKASLGLFLTLHGVLYGISRFVNGVWADRCNARYFMVAGLLLSVGANVFFGFSSTVLWLGVAWMINGWVQGMGFPPCCRLMTHWFHPSRLASNMAVWNTSHTIGAALASVACPYFLYLGWRWCFFGPAILCTVAGLILFILLRDTPRSVGLPEIVVAGAKPGDDTDRSSAAYKAFVKRQVFQNPYIWWISLANFFVYVLRFAVLDWGPTLLKEMKHFSVQKSGFMVGAFEVAGLIGMLLAGWITDRFFQGRGSRTCVFCMIGASTSLFLFWQFGSTPATATAFLAAAGFFIYGPQALIGITAANLATRRAAATAAGFTGLFGYLSTIVSGWGLGRLVQEAGWNVAFGALLGLGALGTFMFILAWPAKAHGYQSAPA